jgi:hypothetical protein
MKASEKIKFAYFQFVPQHYWLYVDGKLAADFVGKYERLQSDFVKVKQKLGIEGNLGTVNATHNVLKLTNSQKQRIKKLYSKDFQLFKYD